jgi:exosortase
MQAESSSKPSFLDELKRLMPEPLVLVGWLIAAVVFTCFYWSSLGHLVGTWYNHEDYQHGFVVPFFALYLLWIRRDILLAEKSKGSLWGLAFFGVWAVMRWTSIYFNYGTLPELSMLPFFAGVALFVGGWAGFSWSWPSILFLFFMMPLPGAVQGLASEQLQSVATRLSTFVIQTFGIAAVAQGNVIQLAERPLEVARACSGLRMMMLFFALCIGAAFIAKRPLWERLVMIASAAPIAVAANVARIVMTAVAYQIGTTWPSVLDLDQYGEAIHNWAGYLMMPIGLLMLLAETSLLTALMIESVEHGLVGGRAMSGARALAGERIATEPRAVAGDPTMARLSQRRRR